MQRVARTSVLPTKHHSWEEALGGISLGFSILEELGSIKGLPTMALDIRFQSHLSQAIVEDASHPLTQPPDTCAPISTVATGAWLYH